MDCGVHLDSKVDWGGVQLHLMERGVQGNFMEVGEFGIKLLHLTMDQDGVHVMSGKMECVVYILASLSEDFVVWCNVWDSVVYTWSQK